MTILQEIEQQARSLSVHEQGRLVHRLLRGMGSSSQPPCGDIEAEIMARVGKIKSGAAVGKPAGEVFAEIGSARG